MEKNYIRFKTIIEVLGKPKEHVEQALKGYLSQIKDDSSLMVVSESMAEAKQQDNMFTIFAELEMVVKNLPTLASFCFDYMPSSVEIIKPEKLDIKNNQLSNFFNDLQAKLHNVDLIAKRLKNENDFLKKNLKTSLKNVILVVIATKKEISKDELSGLAGIELSEIDTFLQELLKEGKIKKEDSLYRLR